MQVKCENCDLKFDSTKVFEMHQNLVHGVQICDEMKLSNKAINENEHNLDLREDEESKRHKMAHKGKSYPCEICDKSFTKRGELKIHERIHTEEKPFSCEICGKSFTQWINLKTHERIHSGENP